jgi:hypothetical protein
MILFKCPSCKCDIQVLDISLIESLMPVDVSYAIRIESTIKHVGPMFEQACIDFFKAFIDDEVQALNQAVKNTQQRMTEMLSQDLHGI